MHEWEIEQLMLKARRRLEVAHRLMEEGFCEDAVSRAYYSMYFAATALFLTRNVRIKTHRGLVTRFGRDFVEGGVIEKEYGRALSIAEDLRSEADYSIDRSITEDECREILMVAGSFMNRMEVAVKDARD